MKDAYAGVFGYLGEGGEICKLGVAEGSYISASSDGDVGGIAGEASNAATITGCYNTGVISASYGNNYVGGIAGWASGATITGCYNTGKVSGCDRTGGIAGEASNAATITGCYNTGVISTSYGNNYVGGIAGHAYGTISGCYNTGVISTSYGNNYVGGIAGYAYGTISGCYNTGDVSGNYIAGGIAGQASCTITGCYNTGAVSASETEGGGSNVGGIAGEALGNAEEGNVTKIMDCYYLNEEVSDKNTATEAVGAVEGEKGKDVIVENCEGKTSVDMQKEDFAKTLSLAVADFEPQWETDTLENVKGLGIEAETLEEAEQGLEEKLDAAEDDAYWAIQALLSQVRQIMFVKSSRPAGVAAFVHISEDTPELWWENFAAIGKTAVGDIKTEITNLGESYGIDTSDELGELERIETAISSAATGALVPAIVAEAQKLLADLKLKLAKPEALAAVDKIKEEVKGLQGKGIDTSGAENSLDGIKEAIGKATTVEQVEEQVKTAQGVLEKFFKDIQSKEKNIGHTRSGIGGDSGFYQAKNGVVTFRVKPDSGYKISKIITSGSTIIRPGDVVKTLPERMTVSFKKV